ncbi:UNVERIFIED_CONTAM: hypothetical protein GTU68_017508 [Idotea baltica]|nr:hypothetical protein [Idotea baltica]
MKISIGILTFGRDDDFKETINCLLDIKLDIELVILNNNELEGGVLDYLKNILPDSIALNYAWDGVNYGVASGRRKLIEITKSDVMLLLDDDIYIENLDNKICKIKDEFIENSSLGGIAFNIKQFSNKINNKYEIPHKNKQFRLDVEQDTYLMIGAGHAIDIHKARLVDSYPNDFGLYGFEEVYLSFKLIASGFDIKYLPCCIVYHKKSPDGRFSNKSVNYLAYRNRMMIASRHLKKRYILSCFIIRTLYFLYKNGRFDEVNDVIINSYREYLYKRDKFNNDFYSKIKKVNGFLWY